MGTALTSSPSIVPASLSSCFAAHSTFAYPAKANAKAAPTTPTVRTKGKAACIQFVRQIFVIISISNPKGY